MQLGVCGYVFNNYRTQHMVDGLVSVSFIEQCDVRHGPVSSHAQPFVVLRWEKRGDGPLWMNPLFHHQTWQTTLRYLHTREPAAAAATSTKRVALDRLSTLVSGLIEK